MPLKSSRFTSVGTKLAGVTVALIVIVTVGVYFRLSRYQREALLHAKEGGASAVTRLFADSSAAALVFEDEAAVKVALATLGRNEEVEYAAVWGLDKAGHVGSRLGELKRGRAETASQAPPVSRLVRERDRLVVTSPVRDENGQLVGVAVVTLSLARENRAIASVQRSILIVSSGVALGLLALLLGMARIAIVGPLAKLVGAAKELEEGGTGVVDVRTNDEVGQLARGFASMASAIRVREEKIGARNRDMRLVLDNVGQGFVTLDFEGTMSEERSRVIDEWFGVLARGVKFWDYLRPVDTKFAQWFEIGWEAVCEDVLPMALCLDQLPNVARKEDRTFELAYRPILEGERLAKLIVVITDVTARVHSEHADQAQREMMCLIRRRLSDRTALDDFFAECGVLVDNITMSEGSDVVQVNRQIHTLKGNAALFGIESVAQFCHELEDLMADSDGGVPPQQKTALRALWAKVGEMHAQISGDGGDDSIEIGGGEHAAFLTDLQRRVPHDVLAVTASSWRFEPASKRLRLVAEQICTLASRLDRSPVEVVCVPTFLRLPPRKWGPLWSVLAHVVRNTVDHAIETAEVRAGAGKPACAKVQIGVAPENQYLVVTVADDGPGIDWVSIAMRAKEMGLPHLTAAELEEALFAPGVSSKSTVTSMSGRGVGLSAVRGLVRELGGDVEVVSEAGRGSTFRLVLPQSMLFDDVPRISPTTPEGAFLRPGTTTTRGAA